MSNGSHYEASALYQIRLKGILDSKWSDWFDGFAISNQDDETLLTGSVQDQAALHGILGKINSLGLTLVSVSQISEMKPDPDHSKLE